MREAPPHDTPIYLNGKFSAQRTTGVQRVATHLVEALDKAIDAGAPRRWVLLCPPGGTPPALHRIAVRHVGPPRLPLHWWEQSVLPAAACDGLLVNLAGAAPWAARRQVCLLHDAAVFDRPRAYSPAFRLWYRLLFRRLARSGAGLLTVSEFSRGRLALRLGVDASRITVIPNGADHFAALAADDNALKHLGLAGTRFLLAVGSANPTKNHAAMLAAWTTLAPDPRRRLVIVGGRDPRVFTGHGAAAPAADPPGVQRAGAVDDAALKALYANATGLVFPSLYEGFGLPPLEAMACGCPVAAARAAAIPEVCGAAALYFDPRSVAAIAHAMQTLLDDAGLRDRLHAAGLAHAARHRWRDAAALLRERLLAGPEFAAAAR